MGKDILQGSCLCGDVTFEVKAPLNRFVHCHCSRCRKATGSAHASGFYVSPEQLKWTSGEHLLVRFDLSSARSFSTTFCKICGAPLPHHTRSGREIIIPAGSIDQEPKVLPESHVFWDSRPRWSCCNEDLPRFSEYPSD